MPDIRIQRDHDLGLARARQVARQWADEAEHRFQMRCEFEPGRGEDTVRFSRSGVDGRLLVTGDRFDLEAKLGFLLGVFSGTIAAEIESHLDAVLAAAPRPAPRAAAARAGPKAEGKAPSSAASAKAASKPAPKKGTGTRRSAR